MAVKFETVKAGDTLYVGLRSKERRRTEWDPMTVADIDSTTRRILVLRNGRQEWKRESDLRRYRRSAPKK